MADWQDHTRRYGYATIDEAVADVVHVMESTGAGVRKRFAQYCARAAQDPRAPIFLASITIDKVPDNELGGGQYRISILHEVTFHPQGANANG